MNTEFGLRESVNETDFDTEYKMNHSHSLHPETWLEEYGDGLYRYALFRLNHPDDAEDVVQEALVSAWRSRSSYQGQSSVRNWLMGILKHKIADQLRKKYKQQEWVEENCDWDQDPVINRMFDSHEHWVYNPRYWMDPQKMLEETELLQTFEGCCSQLPPLLAETFALRILDGLSMEETQTVLNLSSSHVGVLLYRARMYLRRCLEKRYFRKV